MKQLRELKEHPLFIKTFIAFFLMMFALIFVIGAIFDYSMIQYSESEISKASIGKLRIIYNIHDMLIGNVNREALRLSLDNYINAIYGGLKNGNEIHGLNEIMDIQNAIGVLGQVVNSNEGIDSVYIYLEDPGLIISSNLGVSSVNSFYDTGWLKQYQEGKSKGIKATWLKTRLPLNPDILEDESQLPVFSLSTRYVISYIFPLSIYTTPLNGAIVVNVDESWFSRLLNNKDNIDEGNIFIIDSDGNVISHTDDTLIAKNIKSREYIRKIIDSKESEGNLITNFQGERHLVTYYKSQSNGWIYVGAFPLDSLMHKATVLRIRILWITLLFAVLSFILSYFISKRIYNPVNALIQNIKNYKSIDILNSNNEVAILSKAFDTLIKQKSNLNSLLEKNKGNINGKYLVDLANGLTSENAENDMIDMQFPYAHFVCSVLCIDRYKSFSARFAGEQNLYMKTLIIHICEEVLDEAFKCYGTVLEREKILLVINIDNQDTGENMERLVGCFKKIQTEVGKILENTISVGIGSAYTSLDSIKFSYAEALEILGEKLVLGFGAIIQWRPGNSEIQELYHYPVNSEKLMINSLNNGSREGAANAVSELVKGIKSKKEIYCDNIWLIFNQLLGKIMEYLLNHNISIGSVFGENYNIYHQLSTKETIDEVGVWLVEILTIIISYSESRKVNDKKHIDKALEYIHRNYRKDMDVNTMAQQIGISYSQLRRVFVSELGVNLVSYVNNLRVEEAKRLLQQTDANVMEIALSLGYNNDQSFNRFFKKFVGITPGEYRNKSR